MPTLLRAGYDPSTGRPRYVEKPRSMYYKTDFELLLKCSDGITRAVVLGRDDGRWYCADTGRLLPLGARPISRVYAQAVKA